MAPGKPTGKPDAEFQLVAQVGQILESTPPQADTHYLASSLQESFSLILFKAALAQTMVNDFTHCTPCAEAFALWLITNHTGLGLYSSSRVCAGPGSLLLTFGTLCQLNILQESVNPTTGKRGVEYVPRLMTSPSGQGRKLCETVQTDTGS